MSAYGVETLEGKVLLSAAITFAAPTVYTSGAPAHHIALGDFTGDGLTDIAVPNPANNSVTILINNGDGTFHKAAPIKLQDPIDLVTGDFNDDGKTDLAVLTDVIPNRAINLAGSNTVVDALVIYDGAGNGTFVKAAAYKVIQGNRRIVAADFNHDGFTDIAITTANGVGILNNIGGTFAKEQHYHLTTGSISYLTTGDMNGDGNPDLVVALPEQMGVRVLLGNGDGTFTKLKTAPLGTPPVWIAVGDFNGDGKEDVAAVNGDFRNGIFLRLGNGDGTFSKAPVVVHAGAFLESITAGDFNGDGVSDLAVVDFASTLRVLAGNGDATYQPSVAYAGLGPEAFAVYSAVLTPGGKEDLIILRDGNVYVYLNTTP